MSDTDLFFAVFDVLLELAKRHPVAAIAIALPPLVIVSVAQVYPSEAWCLAHPRAFALLRWCRETTVWGRRWLARGREFLDSPLAQAAVERAFAKGKPPVPDADRPTEPPADADPEPVASEVRPLGGSGRRA